jgi:hypothetical protein
MSDTHHSKIPKAFIPWTGKHRRYKKPRHHFVDFITEQKKRQRISWEALESKASVCRSTLYRWRMGKTTPDVVDMEKVFSALGFNLVPIRRNDS